MALREHFNPLGILQWSNSGSRLQCLIPSSAAVTPHHLSGGLHRSEGGYLSALISPDTRKHGEQHFVLRVVQPEDPEERALEAGLVPARTGAQSRGHGLQPPAHQRQREHRRWVCCSGVSAHAGNASWSIDLFLFSVCSIKGQDSRKPKSGKTA